MAPPSHARAPQVKRGCLLCGGPDAPFVAPSPLTVVAASAAQILDAHRTDPAAPFHDLVRRSRAPEPLSCPTCGERAVAIAARVRRPADVLAVNLHWPPGASHDDVADVLRGALLPLDARAALADDDDDPRGGEASGPPRALVAVVAFCADHYTAFTRPRPLSIDAAHPPTWTFHDRFVATASGPEAWLVDECAPPPAASGDRRRAKLPSLLLYMA